MFIELVASNRKAKRPLAGAVASVALHTVLILVAIAATATARTERTISPPTPRVHFFPPAIVRSDASAGRRAPSTPTRTPEQPVSPTSMVAPITIATGVPATTVATPLETASGQASNATGAEGDGVTAVESSGGGPLTELEVDKAVRAFRSNRAPAYPDLLRARGIEGEVLARFVVNELGRVEMKTVELASAASPAFANAVRYALERARFEPAEARGRRVAQLVEQRFQFRLEGR